MRALVWFRADLRVDDNPALAAACRQATEGVIGVFLIAHEQWREHDWGDLRMDFVRRTLAALSADLSHLGVPLLVRSAPRFSQATSVLLGVAREHRCEALFFNREYEVNERERDEHVTQMLENAGVAVHSSTDQVILRPGALRTGTGGWYTVFTPFRKAWLSRVAEDGLGDVESPRRITRPVTVKSDPVPPAIPGFKPVAAAPQERWIAGESEARSRLERFIEDRIREYHAQRNLPACGGTSTLSPYLAVGAISVRRCLHAAVEANRGRLEATGSGPASWINELIWREFYRNILVGFPRVSMGRAFRRETEAIRWRENESDFQAWCEGRTGFPIVDAAMRCLRETGWMHNRLRMIVAMFLTKDLFLDWRLGERHFMRHLIDGDLASNNGGWQWSASTGTDAAPYFRIFNPTEQSRTCDPNGAFIRQWVPELRDLDDRVIHDPSSASPLMMGRIDYPAPIVDHRAARERVLRAFQALKQGEHQS